jgi:cytochrome b
MANQTVQVWDIAVRIFHWSLVIFFTVSYFTGEEESLTHIYTGYAVLGLVVFRLLWGFIGSRHARFSDFIYSRGTVVEYLKSLVSGNPKSYSGHNPAGGWMVIALLVSLALTTLTGIKVYGLEGHGPLADNQITLELIASAYADSDEHKYSGENEAEEELWEEIHEFWSNLTVLLIILHIAGVMISSRIHKENLVKAMITGKKKK